MSLREEMKRYEKLTGESAENIPIIKLGAYLDGVDKGIKELEKIKSEIEHDAELQYEAIAEGLYDAADIIYKHISELKGESEEEE